MNKLDELIEILKDKDDKEIQLLYDLTVTCKKSIYHECLYDYLDYCFGDDCLEVLEEALEYGEEQQTCNNYQQ